jgi:hypothetical protein
VGKIIANDDTLGTPAAPLASGTTTLPVAAGSVIERQLKWVAVTTTKHRCYTNHYRAILVDADEM